MMLVLTNSKGEKSYFRAKGDKLEMLDRNDHLGIDLLWTMLGLPVKASLPTTPMAMRGMYFYMADAATFTDCATGKLRRSIRTMPIWYINYAAAQLTALAVLLTLEGTLLSKRYPDTGEMMKTLMTDQAGKFIPVKTAADDCRWRLSGRNAAGDDRAVPPTDCG